MTTVQDFSMVPARELESIRDTLKNMIFFKMTQFVDIDVRIFVDKGTPLIDEVTYVLWRDTLRQTLSVLNMDPRAIPFLANFNNALESFRRNKIGMERIWQALVL